jgi:hypothetical protein
MSIVNALPGIAPTARSFKMAEWPQTRIKTRAGRTVRLAQVDTPAGATMDLVWENITYTQAETICNAWDVNYGIYGTLLLDAATLAGLSDEAGSNVSGLMLQPFPGATWRASGPPVAEAVKRRRCTVRLPLVARNDFLKPLADLVTLSGDGIVTLDGSGLLVVPLVPTSPVDTYISALSGDGLQTADGDGLVILREGF